MILPARPILINYHTVVVVYGTDVVVYYIVVVVNCNDDAVTSYAVAKKNRSGLEQFEISVSLRCHEQCFWLL